MIDDSSSPSAGLRFARLLRRAALAVGLLGIAVAHLPLLTYDPGRGRFEGIEDALFEPTSASPGVVMVCWLWLLYSRWPRLRALEGEAKPSAGAPLLLVGGALCLWAHYVGAPSLLLLSLSLLVLASGLTLAGTGALRILIFPCAFLLLALPVPTPLINAVMYPLQLANAAAAAFVLDLAGFDTTLSGDLILVNGRVFQVIESCSGLRTTLTVVMSACLYVELFWHDRRRSLALLLLSPLVGVFSNHLRILTIVLNPYASLASVHAAQGLGMLVVAVLSIALLDMLLARLWKTPPDPYVAPGRPTGTLPLAVSGSYAVIGLSLAVASLGLTPWKAQSEPLPSLVEISADLPGWRVSGSKPDREFLGSVRYDESISHRYERPGEPAVEVFVAGDRRLDPMLGIVSEKTLIPGGGGVRLPVDLPGEVPSPLIEVAVVRFPAGAMLVYHWRSGIASWPEELVRAVLALDRSPFRRPGRAVVVRLATQIENHEGGLDEANTRLVTFTHALRGDFERLGIWPGSD